MPATLKSLTRAENELTVAYEDDSAAVTVRYRQNVYTARLVRELEAFADGNATTMQQFDATVALLLAYVAEWDFRLDEGEPPLPLTTEALSDVPIEFQTAIISAIQDDQSPKAATTA